MKKIRLQIILISILVLGMISILISLNLSFPSRKTNDYIPTNIDESETLRKEINLNDYQKIDFEKKSFPIFNDLIEGQIYFDSNLSYKEYEVDVLNYNLGDIVKKNEILGKFNNIDIVLDSNCMIVEIRDDKVNLKILDKVYIRFSFDIYESTSYKIGDEFSIFKNDKKVTSGEIISIDYLNIVDDCASAIIEVDNSNLLFLNNTGVSFTANNYETRENYSTLSSFFNIFDGKYRILNEFKSLICIKDKKVYSINIKLGICFGQYVEVIEAISDFKAFDFINGECYVKNTIN